MLAKAAASLQATHAEVAAILAEVHPSFSGDSDAVQLEWQRYTSKVSPTPSCHETHSCHSWCLLYGVTGTSLVPGIGALCCSSSVAC